MFKRITAFFRSRSNKPEEKSSAKKSNFTLRKVEIVNGQICFDGKLVNDNPSEEWCEEAFGVYSKAKILLERIPQEKSLFNIFLDFIFMRASSLPPLNEDDKNKLQSMLKTYKINDSLQLVLKAKLEKAIAGRGGLTKAERLIIEAQIWRQSLQVLEECDRLSRFANKWRAVLTQEEKKALEDGMKKCKPLSDGMKNDILLKAHQGYDIVTRAGRQAKLGSSEDVVHHRGVLKDESLEVLNRSIIGDPVVERSKNFKIKPIPKQVETPEAIEPEIEKPVEEHVKFEEDFVLTEKTQPGPFSGELLRGLNTLSENGLKLEQYINDCKGEATQEVQNLYQKIKDQILEYDNLKTKIDNSTPVSTENQILLNDLNKNVSNLVEEVNKFNYSMVSGSEEVEPSKVSQEVEPSKVPQAPKPKDLYLLARQDKAARLLRRAKSLKRQWTARLKGEKGSEIWIDKFKEVVVKTQKIQSNPRDTDLIDLNGELSELNIDIQFRPQEKEPEKSGESEQVKEREPVQKKKVNVLLATVKEVKAVNEKLELLYKKVLDLKRAFVSAADRQSENEKLKVINQEGQKASENILEKLDFIDNQLDQLESALLNNFPKPQDIELENQPKHNIKGFDAIYSTTPLESPSKESLEKITAKLNGFEQELQELGRPFVREWRDPVVAEAVNVVSPEEQLSALNDQFQLLVSKAENYPALQDDVRAIRRSLKEKTIESATTGLAGLGKQMNAMDAARGLLNTSVENLATARDALAEGNEDTGLLPMINERIDDLSEVAIKAMSLEELQQAKKELDELADQTQLITLSSQIVASMQKIDDLVTLSNEDRSVYNGYKSEFEVVQIQINSDNVDWENILKSLDFLNTKLKNLLAKYPEDEE